MSSIEDELVGQAWAALSADDTGAHPALPAQVEVVGGAVVFRRASWWRNWPKRRSRPRCSLPRHSPSCGESRSAPCALDRGHVADAVRSERYFRVAGQPAGASFAPLSRFWPTADGWVRTHANYPWHRTALLDTLGTAEDEAAVASAIAELSAADVEAARVRRGRNRGRGPNARRSGKPIRRVRRSRASR